MFPDKLDNANVIEYTYKSNFGYIGGSPYPIYYFAICRYKKDRQYYLFYCDKNKEVNKDKLIEDDTELYFKGMKLSPTSWL